MTDLFAAAPLAPPPPPLPGADITTSIIDNDGANTLRNRLRVIGDEARELSVASAFFSLDGLALLADVLEPMGKIRILFGDDADAANRQRLLYLLRTRSDTDLADARTGDSLTLSPLKRVEALIAGGRVEARCYTAKKFHAKAYLFRYAGYRAPEAIIGSGNLTRAGLTANVELNVKLTDDQKTQLADWFEARWNEAGADVVTEDLLREVQRQITLYDPYVLYLKALHAWGASVQDAAAAIGPQLYSVLDPHQETAFRQATRILQRQSGVMICDGVGLGKSFIALALMESFLTRNKTVLLIAPKSILLSSWNGYLERYLPRYFGRYPSLYREPMTAFGFDPEKEANDLKANDLRELAERADVIVIDESHNFRTPSASRYKNLWQVIAPGAAGRKKVILLTATPVNTEYADLSAQVALTTHDDGAVDGLSIAQIRRAATNLDREARLARAGVAQTVQTSLDFVRDPARGGEPLSVLRQVLESVVIQRSRKTCRELARAAGKELLFPVRRDPQCLSYTFDAGADAYRKLIALSDALFRPGIDLLKKLQDAEREARAKNKKYDPIKILERAKGGIKLAAFSLDQYLLSAADRSDKRDKDEIHLAKLVFTNALKQLESSPAAYQGILQSLAIGLIARLKHVLGDSADLLIADHRAWVKTDLFREETADESLETESDLLTDGDSLDHAQTETDDWLQKAIDARGLDTKLAGFSDRTHDVTRWRNDIVSDLGYLREIHAATLAARAQTDPKLAEVERLLCEAVMGGKRVLLFTQSQRTAEYVERELKTRFDSGVGIARIDSHVEEPRAAILHAFCPGYNPAPAKRAASVPGRVDILISTDVLAEGVNLQETGLIVNYDIHWNPVRLIQRIGRVDRRLDPAITPVTPSFDIVNIVPPPEIETIIALVGRIEDRTIKISKTMGLETSFFKSSDDAGTLREFNAEYDGELSDADTAMARYVEVTTVAPPDAKTRALLEQLPPGAFGVWADAPETGLFAYFAVLPKKHATDADQKRFASVLSRPYFAFVSNGKPPVTDAPALLALLGKTVPHVHSANPSPDETLKAMLQKAREAVRRNLQPVGLPATFGVSLVCAMEWRKK